MSNSGLAAGLFGAFINWLYSTGEITVPKDYHKRCSEIQKMLDDDVSGLVSTITRYSVNSASGANYNIQCSEETLQKLLNLWLKKINLDVSGISTGLQSLSKEYYKERWQGSSFCILRVRDWEKIEVDNVTIEVPTTIWFVNGASIHVKRPKSKNYKLGSDKYYLDEAFKNEIPSKKDEEIIIQKPFNRWFDKYSSPYLVNNGVLKNWLAIKVLQNKTDEVISKFLPYLFLITKGTEELFTNADINYDDEDMKKVVENFKQQTQKYKNKKGKVPANAVPFDTKYEHLIPDLRKILTEELYRQGYRAILAGLGFIDMLEISPSRQENRLNPRPFISEVNAGVDGFKEILLEVIYHIVDRNKSKHKKLFSDNKKLLIVNSPLRINIEQIIDQLRSGYVYGVSSITTYQEILGLDPETEKERREQELEDGLEELFHPHVIINREDIPDRTEIKPKTKKQIEKDKEKEKAIELEIAPYDKKNPPAFLKKYPKGAQEVFIEVFNKNLPKGEDYAYPVAWTALKRWMKKHGYKKVNDKWVKSEEKDNG